LENESLENIIVSIGGLAVTNKPAILQTLLGSCVSVTMFDPVCLVAGLNHIVLPGTFLEHDFEQMLDEKNSRYGIFSLEKLLYQMEQFGTKRKDIIAKIFGASIMNRPDKSVLRVQESNVEFVEAFLSMARIKIIEKIVLQPEPLKIFLNTQTGDVKIVRLKNL